MDVESQSTKIWAPAAVEIIPGDQLSTTIPWNSEGINKSIYTTANARRFAPGIPTAEIFSTSAD